MIQEYLQRGDGKSVGQFLFDPLLDVLSRVDYIIFPMRHHDQFHFTLLVLQKDEEQWVHYDPMRCVTDTSNDRCFADAEKLVSIVLHLPGLFIFLDIIFLFYLICG